MTWTLALIVLAASFAGLASIRQYAELNKTPVQSPHWDTFKKKYLNLTMIFIFLAASCAVAAAYFQYQENDKVTKKNEELQEKLTHYVFGANEVPAFTASIIGNKILFTVANPDKDFPIYNVKIKCRENLFPDIGTLYPNVSKIVASYEMPPGKEELWYFIIWYNNDKNFEADIEIKQNDQGSLVATTKYLNEKELEFIPPWKKRADSINKIKDTSVHHYHPNQHM